MISKNAKALNRLIRGLERSIYNNVDAHEMENV